MKRLNNTTLQHFLKASDIAVVMFGAPEGEATMDQAVEFAHAWMEHRGEASFGYVDAFENISAARSHAVRVLPTTLVLRQGEIVSGFEGRCPRARITSAVNAANPRRAAA